MKRYLQCQVYLVVLTIFHLKGMPINLSKIKYSIVCTLKCVTVGIGSF